MKKIDLHIHTVPTTSDSHFDFDMATLKDYVRDRDLDCIAITNHNYFDVDQFREITTELSDIVVFPGIEINLEEGHLLLIANANEMNDFAQCCIEITNRFKSSEDSIEFVDLETIYKDLSRYILIPHYLKKPEISSKTLTKLAPYVTAGEVSSPKKFKHCIKNSDALVPVFFSDTRMETGKSDFPIRQTYIDAGEIDFSALRMCLSDKDKVFLSKEDGHQFFDALANGLRLSTGLNIILGERSSGKSYTLQLIDSNFENVKYVRQFSLLERNENDDKERFNSLLSQRQSLITQEYLKEFQAVVDSMASVDLERSERKIKAYLKSLKKNAQEYEKADIYAKTKLFNEVVFPEVGLDGLKTVINAVTTLIDTSEFRSIIDKFISVENLKELAVELMREHIRQHEVDLKKRWINDLIETIRQSLVRYTSVTPIKDIDLYLIAVERKKVEKFSHIVHGLKKERTILQKDVQTFKMVANTREFLGAGELKNQSGKKVAFSEAFKTYENPYHYLKALRKINGIEEAEYFKFFTRIEYKILNKHGFEVSGGERSEFRLLQEIQDAQQFDMLLIDEPESSFDNLFLKKDVNKLIREISRSVPVVLVTHNNTVGASIKPDYVVYTKRVIQKDKVRFEHYSGFPSDKSLKSIAGKKIKNFEILMNCLEAGIEAYSERGRTYEILKD